MLAHPFSHRQKPDAAMIVLGSLLLVGLLCIAITGWIVYTRQQNQAQARSNQITNLPSALQGTSKEWADMPVQKTMAAVSKQGYETPQTELDRLHDELAQVQRALATLSVQATVAAATSQTREAQYVQELDRVHHELSLSSTRALPTTPTMISLTPSTVLEKPPLALVLNAPVYKQERSLSCESSSAAMAANFFGVQVSEAQILASLPLDENPSKGFRGNVDGPYGGLEDYGVYAEPIRKVLVDLGLTVETFQGGMEDIRAHLRHGRVIIAWITYDLGVQTPRQVALSDGESVLMVPFEHALLVVGYNSTGFWVNDPYSGMAKLYAENEFARSFAYLENMALVVGP
jgi:uncharacterized protein YvpB